MKELKVIHFLKILFISIEEFFVSDFVSGFLKVEQLVFVFEFRHFLNEH